MGLVDARACVGDGDPELVMLVSVCVQGDAALFGKAYGVVQQLIDGKLGELWVEMPALDIRHDIEMQGNALLLGMFQMGCYQLSQP
jgi:hypothetical protein